MGVKKFLSLEFSKSYFLPRNSNFSDETFSL